MRTRQPRRPPVRPRSPVGREAVRRALLEAAARLFAEHGDASVSVRDVAEAAGVNHGLVHRHFGSKENLLRAVLDDLSRRIAEESILREPGSGTPKLSELFSVVFAVLDNHPDYFRILARAMLDGKSPQQLQSGFPMVAHLVERVRAAQRHDELDDTFDARMLVAVAVATGLGWLAFEPFIAAATGQERVSRKTTRKKLHDTWLALASHGALVGPAQRMHRQ